MLYIFHIIIIFDNIIMKKQRELINFRFFYWYLYYFTFPLLFICLNNLLLFFYRIQYIWTEIASLKMATTRQLHLCHSQSLNPDPQFLHSLQPRLSRGSSGEGSTSSCSPASDTVWDWGTCGGSPIFVTAMEEVSGLQSCPFPFWSLKCFKCQAACL